MADIRITPAIIAAIAPAPRLGALAIAEALDAALPEYEIDTPARIAACLAQLAHESAGFRTLVEYASGQAYEGRVDLGNTHTGDGVKFKGRGFIQITGRSNYERAGKALGVDLIAHPEALEEIDLAATASAWFWRYGSPIDLNTYADAGDGTVAYRGRTMPAFEAITRVINGGTNGIESRREYWRRARNVLGA